MSRNEINYKGKKKEEEGGGGGRWGRGIPAWYICAAYLPEISRFLIPRSAGARPTRRNNRLWRAVASAFTTQHCAARCWRQQRAVSKASRAFLPRSHWRARCTGGAAIPFWRRVPPLQAVFSLTASAWCRMCAGRAGLAPPPRCCAGKATPRAGLTASSCLPQNMYKLLSYSIYLWAAPLMLGLVLEGGTWGTSHLPHPIPHLPFTPAIWLSTMALMLPACDLLWT